MPALWLQVSDSQCKLTGSHYAMYEKKRDERISQDRQPRLERLRGVKAMN